MTDKKPLNIDIQSEIGQLDAVLLHTPGAEVENMTPKMAQRALYSDILNLSIAQEEYAQLSGVLEKLAKVYTVSDLLVKVLDNDAERQALIGKICVMEQVTDYFDMLMDMSSARLAKVLIEGLPAKINTLTSFLNEDYYALFPLYNFYFTRDAAVTIGNNALICKMANRVRTRESLIMEAIYKGSGEFSCGIINAYDYQPGNPDIYMEGGDILIARDDILLLGNGARTSTQGIDLLAARLGALAPEGRRHIIVQQLPRTPESFIHLDMVFTLLDRDKCMVFEPLILGDNQYQTVHITMENGKRTSSPSCAAWAWTSSPSSAEGSRTNGTRKGSSGTAEPISSPSPPARSSPTPATPTPWTSCPSTASRSSLHGTSSRARRPSRATSAA